MKLILYIALCLILTYFASGFVKQTQTDFDALLDANPLGAGFVECRPSYFQRCP